jgi:hypothetical protein
MLTIVLHEVAVGTIPDFPRDRTAGVELHAHALLLGTLTGEDVCRNGLLNLSFTKQDLFFCDLVAHFDLDDLATSNHTSMLQLDLNQVIG